MRKFDLQPTFGSGRALTEDFEDEPGAIDHLSPDLVFEIALLDRRQLAVDDDELGLV